MSTDIRSAFAPLAALVGLAALAAVAALLATGPDSTATGLACGLAAGFLAVLLLTMAARRVLQRRTR